MRYIYIFLSTKRKYIFCLRYSIRSISKNFDTQGIIINVASTTGENHPQKSSPRGFNHTLRPIILELIERTKYICTHVKYTTFKHSRDTLDGRKIWWRSPSLFFLFFFTRSCMSENLRAPEHKSVLLVSLKRTYINSAWNKGHNTRFDIYIYIYTIYYNIVYIT